MYSLINSFINRFSCEMIGFSFELSSRILNTSALNLDFNSFVTPLFSNASLRTKQD